MKFKFFFLLLLAFPSFFLSQNLTDVKICINPGHGGYDADDRNVVIAPYKTGDKNGFWESVSNLDKGFALKSLLESAGANVIMTRTSNTTDDDLPLSQIVAMANQNNVDFMLSIHSNAGSGVANHVLMIHVGVDPTDSQIYNTFNPGNPAHAELSTKSREISTEIAKNIYSNQITTWSSSYAVRGDKTFARQAMGWSDGYGVLRALYVPGVISEGAMHDYIPETYRLMNLEYKWLEAWQFYKSFCNYFKGGNIPTGNVAGSVRDSRIKNDANYNKFKGKDEMLPLNGTTLTLIETGQNYTVDNHQNGVFVFKNLTPGVYHVKAEKTGYHAQSQEITVTGHNISYFNFGLNRIRNTPPQVIAYSPNVAPTDSVDASTSILLEFNWDMDETSTGNAFSITPHVDGKITFEDTQYKMRFTPDKPLDKATVYTVKLAKTASHPDNLSMTEDFSFQFMTKNRNRLSLISGYPNTTHNKVHFNNPYFRLIFDKKLNTGNLQTAVRIRDHAGNVVSKITRSVINNQLGSSYGSNYFRLINNLTIGQNYVLEIDGEVMDEVGMQLVEPISIPFIAVDALTQQGTKLKDFETVSLEYDPTQSSETASASVVLSSTALSGTYANQLSASLNNVNSSAFYKFKETFNVNTEKIIGLHLFGDQSGNEVQLQFKSPSETGYATLCHLNFFGWEYHEVNLGPLSGAKTLEITGIRIIRKQPWTWSASADVYVDHLLSSQVSISSVKNPWAKSISVYPNPASDKIFARTISGETPVLQLFTLSGIRLREVRATEMLINDFPAGTYLLRIIAGKEAITRTLMILR